MNFIDSRELGNVEGFDIVAYEVYDETHSPYDSECYSVEDIEAWKNDQWYYAGVIVKAYRNNIPLGEASIWGCDTGDYWDRGDGSYREILEENMSRHEDTGQPYDAWAHGYGSDLVIEAISEAKATIEALMEA